MGLGLVAVLTLSVWVRPSAARDRPADRDQEEKLAHAAIAGDLDQVKALIKAGVDVNSQGGKPLSCAITYGQPAVVKELQGHNLFWSIRMAEERCQEPLSGGK
jgi:hypothetical protein